MDERFVAAAKRLRELTGSDEADAKLESLVAHFASGYEAAQRDPRGDTTLRIVLGTCAIGLGFIVGMTDLEAGRNQPDETIIELLTELERHFREASET